MSIEAADGVISTVLALRKSPRTVTRCHLTRTSLFLPPPPPPSGTSSLGSLQALNIWEWEEGFYLSTDDFIL